MRTFELGVSGGLKAKGVGEIVLQIILPALRKRREAGQTINEVNYAL
jgi:hypothetical protein